MIHGSGGGTKGQNNSNQVTILPQVSIQSSEESICIIVSKEVRKTIQVNIAGSPGRGLVLKSSPGKGLVLKIVSTDEPPDATTALEKPKKPRGPQRCRKCGKWRLGHTCSSPTKESPVKGRRQYKVSKVPRGKESQRSTLCGDLSKEPVVSRRKKPQAKSQAK
jgi:hypothetical protein